MKTPKNAKEIICEKCNFKCFKNSEYKRHLITAKHKNITFRTEKTPKNAIIYSCDCGKTYKSRSSLWYHKKKCSHSNVIEQENQEEYNDIESEFSQKCVSIQRNLYPDNPRETAINKVIENITQNSTIMDYGLNKKLISNNTENNIKINITEQMDISKMSKLELLE